MLPFPTIAFGHKISFSLVKVGISNFSQAVELSSLFKGDFVPLGNKFTLRLVGSFFWGTRKHKPTFS